MSDEQHVVVTEDIVMRTGKGKLHPHDLKVMNPGPNTRVVSMAELAKMIESGEIEEHTKRPKPLGKGFTAIKSVEEFRELGAAGAATYDAIRLRVGMAMSPERAARVRQLRVEEHYSWRALAAQLHDEWKAQATWQPPSNQIAGIVLCRCAAVHFNENDREPPWN